MSGFGFGQQPAGGNFNFGANKPATTTTGFGFGTTPAATQAGTAFGATTFGSNQATGLGGQLNFGAGPSTAVVAPTPGGFGAPMAAPTPQFPATATAPAGTGLFGATSGSTLNFGATPTAQPAPQPAAQPSLFGTPATSQPAVPTLGAQPSLSFGAVSTQAQPTAGLFSAATTNQPTIPTLNFGAPPATTKPATGLFGLSTPATTSVAGGLGAGLSTSTATTTPSLGLGGLGTSTSVATSAPSTGFAFPSTSTTFNLGATTTPSLGLLSSTASTLPSLTPATTTTTSIGLGGVNNSAASGGLAGSGSSGRQESKTVKENPIPNEVAQLVENFRTYVKQQKSLSCEVARCSERPLQKVKEDTEALRQLLATTSAGLQRCRTIADKLKFDTAKGLQHVEMAQRTHDTPPGLQYDNTAPLAYFAELVSNFERDIQLFRQQIETAERHVKSQTQAAALSPAELTQALRRLHDSFVALAGRLQNVHSAVEAQKEQYLSLRKYTLNDTTDVFQEASKAQASASGSSGFRPNAACRNTAGPTPFSSLGGQQGLGFLGIGGVPPTCQTFSPANPLGECVAAGAPGSTMGTSFLSLQTPDSSTFQLQKPPAGNKRGKR